MVIPPEGCKKWYNRGSAEGFTTFLQPQGWNHLHISWLLMKEYFSLSRSLYPATPYWIFFSFFIFHCTLKTPETNSTTFILAATLQTKNQKIAGDWGNRNRVIIFLFKNMFTSSDLHCEEVVQCSVKDFSKRYRAYTELSCRIFSFKGTIIQRWVCL
jgi:hypothetical protein